MAKLDEGRRRLVFACFYIRRHQRLFLSNSCISNLIALMWVQHQLAGFRFRTIWLNRPASWAMSLGKKPKLPGWSWRSQAEAEGRFSSSAAVLMSNKNCCIRARAANQMSKLKSLVLSWFFQTSHTCNSIFTLNPIVSCVFDFSASWTIGKLVRDILNYFNFQIFSIDFNLSKLELFITCLYRSG